MNTHLIGKAIREHRRKQRLTQSQLALSASIPLRTYLRIEACDPSVQLGTYLRAAQALGYELTLAPRQRPTLDELDAIFAEDSV